MIENICNLEKDDVERLLNLKFTCVMKYDYLKRKDYHRHYIKRKYEDWECKQIIDLNKIDIFEICEVMSSNKFIIFCNTFCGHHPEKNCECNQ